MAALSTDDDAKGDNESMDGIPYNANVTSTVNVDGLGQDGILSILLM